MNNAVHLSGCPTFLHNFKEIFYTIMHMQCHASAHIHELANISLFWIKKYEYVNMCVCCILTGYYIECGYMSPYPVFDTDVSPCL